MSKETKIKIFNLNKFGIINTILFLLSYTIIELTPGLLNEIQPDSLGYMYPSKNRQTLYYLFITSLNKLGISIIFFQKVLLSFSIASLVFFIGSKTSVLLGLLSYFCIILNTGCFL